MTLPTILLPVFVFVLLVFVLLVALGRTRFAAGRRGEVRIADIALDDRPWPDSVRKISNAYNNQFQLPLLFIAATILAIIAHKADIVFLDLHHINWIPMNDPVNQIVHTEDGSGVHSVMIGGRMIVENRKLLTVDLPKLAAQAAASQARRAELTGEGKKLYEKLESVVGTFCPGLAKAPLHIHRHGASHHHN